jgi:hypothetical protein
VLQNCCISEGLFDFPECQFRFSHPFPFGVDCLLEQIRDGSGYLSILLNKPAVDVLESDKYLDVFVRLGSWLVLDDRGAIRLHADAITRDDKSQQADFRDSELTLFRLAIECEIL